MKKEHRKWYILFRVVIIIFLALICIYPIQTIKVLVGLGLLVIALMAIFSWIMGKRMESFEKSFKQEEEENGRFRHP